MQPQSQRIWIPASSEAMYLRTNLYGSMSEGIAKSRGFEIMKNNNEIITEEVSFKRTNPDISETDMRKFLVKRFK